MKTRLLTSIAAAALLALAAPSAGAQLIPILPGEGPVNEQLSPRSGALTPSYFLGSLVASGFGTGAIALTANPGGWTPVKRWHAYLGIASGAAAMALSASELDASGDRRTLAAVNGIIGTASFTLGLRALLTAGDAERRMAQRRLAVAPVVMLGRDARNEDVATLGGSVRFRF